MYVFFWLSSLYRKISRIGFKTISGEMSAVTGEMTAPWNETLYQPCYQTIN